MLLGGVWALVTWAGIGGVAFPIPIMALVPVRMYLLPRCEWAQSEHCTAKHSSPAYAV